MPTWRFVGTVGNRTQMDAERRCPPARAAFPANQMLTFQSTDTVTSEALWSKVTCMVFRAGCWECEPDWWLRERIGSNHILFICVPGGTECRNATIP